MSALPMLGLDLSLTSTGYAIGGNGSARSGRLVPVKGYDRGMPRLIWVRNSIKELVYHSAAKLVVLEGYSFGSRASQAHALGELGGVVRVALTEMRVAWCDVPPSSLKLYATGKGNASKEEVLVAAVKRLGYQGASNDEADALWLLMMAGAQYGAGATNEHGRRALAAVAWPRLEGGAA